MSWLVRSLTAPFQDEQHPLNISMEGESYPSNSNEEKNEPRSPAGVKEDLSELTNTLKRQFWGVAHFIAPPPSPKYQDDRDDPDGIRTNDLSGRFKMGISRISSVIQSLADDEDKGDDKFSGSAKPVGFSASLSGISRFASSFLPSNLGELGGVEDEDQVVGLTEEVVSFAAQITQHPGTWLDFPLDRDNGEDFDMSDVQQEHALSVEHYVPSLAALRIELCPGYMSENRFWMIYFMLIHPRLSKEAALILSTPQVLEARALLSQELQRRNITETNNDARGLDCTEGSNTMMHQEQKYEHVSPVTKDHEHTAAEAKYIDSATLPTTTVVTTNDVEGDTQLSSLSEASSQTTTSKDLSLQNENVMARASNLSDAEHYDEDIEVENWLQEEADGNEAPMISGSGSRMAEEDVSFSDLEDDDDS